MSKRSKLILIIGAIAAVVSAVVTIVMFWDKILEKCPFCKKRVEECEEDDDVLIYTEAEAKAFADLQTAE